MVSASAEESRREAIGGAVRFLAERLPASGIVPATVVDRAGERRDETVFATALTLPALAAGLLEPLDSLAAAPALRSFRAAAGRFLAAEEGPTGLWKFWPRGHPRAAGIPHDLDDSACAGAALADLEGPAATRRRAEVALRIFSGPGERSGGVRTWLVPRSFVGGWLGPISRTGASGAPAIRSGSGARRRSTTSMPAPTRISSSFWRGTVARRRGGWRRSQAGFVRSSRGARKGRRTSGTATRGWCNT
ncbi:MAG: hypothetical protein R2862_00550 [Thermoanaerobaculia bacterium]